MEQPTPELSTPNQVQRDVIILVVILALICCCGIALAIGGFMVYERYNETQAISGTATSQYMATKIKQDTDAQATVQAQATATAFALKLQATATAQAKTNLLAGYTHYDTFDDNANEWRAGEESNEYWVGKTAIENGRYLWQVDEALDTFIAWADFGKAEALADFDVAVLAQRTAGQPEDVCYGLFFRKSAEGFEAGTYALSVCENGYFSTLYYDENVGWEKFQDWTLSDAIYLDQPNLIEVSARGSDFVISINNQQVAEFSDDRLKEGSVALFIDFYEKAPGTIWFDNFALQPR